ncbi:hypothetical protein J4732_19280 [Serratia marcescens]|uniref:Uncharacterized protein n=1 Tax=Serratia marcescens TaxID=615 RepID=A0A939NQF3_SERMA|nr:hypothetical protein [Serratia marcescens]
MSKTTSNPTNVGNRLVNAPTNMGGLYLSHRMTLPVVPGEGARRRRRAMSAAAPAIGEQFHHAGLYRGGCLSHRTASCLANIPS